jgi:hypothetical protein
MVAAGRDEEAWESAQMLAQGVLEAHVVLAQAVLDAGPFAMRSAEDLAELILSKPPRAKTESK